MSIKSRFINLSHNSILSDLIDKSSKALVYKILAIALGYIFTILVARLYGPEILGILSLCIIVITISGILGGLGADTAILRLISKYSPNKDQNQIKLIYKNGFFLSLLFSSIATIAFLLFSSLIANYVFQKPQLIIHLKISALGILPMTIITLNSQTMRGLKRTSEFIIYKFLLHLLVAIIMILSLSSFFHSQYIPLISFISGLTIISLISQVKILQLIRSSDCDSPLETFSTKNFFFLSISLLITNFIIFSRAWIDIIMLGILSTNYNVGLFSLSIKISALVNIPLAAINAITAPKFAEYHGTNKLNDLKKTVNYSTKLIFFTSLPILITIIIFNKLLLGMAGETYMSGSVGLIILCIGQFVNSISGSVGFLMQMTGQQKILSKITLLALVIVGLLNYFLIPYYGFLGAAIATSAGNIFWNLTLVYIIKQKFNIITIYNPFRNN